MRRRHTPPQLPARRRPATNTARSTVGRPTIVADARWRRGQPPRSMATSAARRPPSAAAHPSLRAAHARARVASTWRRRADPPTTGLAWPIVGHRRVCRAASHRERRLQQQRANERAVRRPQERSHRCAPRTHARTPPPPRPTTTGLAHRGPTPHAAACRAGKPSHRDVSSERRPPSAGAQPSLRAAHARAAATACRHRRRPKPAVCSRHHLRHVESASCIHPPPPTAPKLIEARAMTQGAFLQEFAQPSAASAQATARRCMQLHAVSKQHKSCTPPPHVPRCVQVYSEYHGTRVPWYTVLEYTCTRVWHTIGIAGYSSSSARERAAML